MRRLLARNLGMTLVAVWLIIWGLSGLGLHFPGLAEVLAILAIAAGIVILIGR